MKSILSAYLKRLTNLSGRNRSLLLLRNSAVQDIDFHKIISHKKEEDLKVFENLIRNKDYPLTDNLDPRSGKRNEIAANLSKILRRDDFIWRESGAKDLYLAWPFVHGKLAGEQTVRCPLLFFPVTLELKDNSWLLKPRPDVNITFNKSFLLAYSYFNRIRLDDDFLETVFNDFDSDMRPFLTELYQLLRDSPIELNFNQELFLEKLSPFRQFQKEEFDKKYGPGELKLFPEAVLGIFPQAGSHLVTDYNDLVEKSQFSDLEDFFLQKNPAKEEEQPQGSAFRMQFLNKIKEEDIYTPFPIDASQENALKAVKKHNSIVVQGPPGSGKSQLICNLISDFASRGKRVLLVCQKRAALDVVYERLREIKAERFCALVHDFKNDRKAIYEQIADQIDRLHEYEQLNNGLDTIFLERNYLKACRQIDALTEELEDFKNALFDTSESGRAAKELYMQSDPSKPAVDLDEEFSRYRFEDIESALSKWESYARLYFKFETDDYLWKDRVSFAEFTGTDLNCIINALKEIPVFKQNVNEKISLFASREMSLEEHLEILTEEKDLRAFLRIIQDQEVYEAFRFYLDKKSDLLLIQNRMRIIMDCFTGPGVEMTVRSDELAEVRDILENALSKRKNIVNWWLYSAFSKESYALKRILVQNQLELNRNNLGILEKKLNNRMNLEHNLSFLRNQPWIMPLPESRLKPDLQRWFDIQQQAIQAKDIISSFRTVRENFSFKEHTVKEVSRKMEGLIELSRLIEEKFRVWNKHLSKKQIDEYLFSDRNQDKLISRVRSDFEELCFYDRIKSELGPTDTHMLHKVLDHPEVSNEDEFRDVLMNSLNITWIEHLEIKYPELRMAGSSELDQKVSELQQAIMDKEAASNEILLMRLRENTYKELEYNRLKNLVTYRDLKHQVSKKRRIWPMRQLISKHFDELFNLIPCWMASTESVSAIFPLEEVFDLVIFDEASQCFSEQGIPAVYRGRQTVIMGDSQQLQPNNLYQVRYDLEDEDNPDLESESFLDLGSRYLMTTQLKGHYRSASLDLIDFSNRHFYQQSLRFLPSPKSLFSTEPAIRYHYLSHGIWENNQNRMEAEEVVRLVKNYIDEGITNIGVITFNYFQQNLIQDLLEENAIDEDWVIPDEVFVKNIENVQGDERDVIIFSISYAKDLKGKLRHQFGSLNAANGENRLNVAVTRARKKIDVVASIKAQELKTEDLKHKGPELLKKYLQYAYDVSEGKEQSEFKHPETFSQEWYLKNRIGDWMDNEKISYSDKLPFVDLMVEVDNKGKLVFTDDDIFYNSYSAKEVFAYRPMELQKKNWEYTFCLSRNYWTSPEEELLKIKRFINR
jgi:superfamily I DNA and/or RNA helicase